MPFFAVCGSTDSLFYGRALRYDLYTGKFNAQVFIGKLKAFMRNRARPHVAHA